MSDTPLPGYSGMPQPPNQKAPAPAPEAEPSFGLPPETPIMPGTSDHVVELVPSPVPTNNTSVSPAASAIVPPVTPTTQAEPKPQPISNVIMPKHVAPIPPPVVSPTPQPIPAPQPATPPPTPPLRTSMYDAAVRGVAGASPKDYGIIENINRTSTPPAKPTGTPQAPARPSAQDAMYQSALGAPLEGPVIPSTRPPLSNLPPQATSSIVPPRPVSSVYDVPRQPSVATRLPQGTLEAVPTPSEAARDVSAPPPVATTPAEAANEMARRTAIRTLESDVATTIQQNRLTVGGIALAQQKKMAEEAIESIPEGKKFSWWALSGIVLALLGVSVVTVAYLMQVSAPETVEEVITTQDAIIPSVPETTLDITDMNRADILRTLSALSGQYAARGGISLIRLTTFSERVVNEETVSVETDVPAEQFLEQLSSRAPDRLARSLGDQTFFGVVTENGRPIPFFAFDVTAYDSAFAGMLEWEQFLAADIPFVSHTPPAPSPAPVETSTATSTSTSTPATGTSTPALATTTTPTVAPAPTAAPKFVDAVVKNHDVRVLKNQDGSTKLLYAFPTPVMLVIAQNEAVLAAIIDHLNTARFSR